MLNPNEHSDEDPSYSAAVVVAAIRGAMDASARFGTHAARCPDAAKAYNHVRLTIAARF